MIIMETIICKTCSTPITQTRNVGLKKQYCTDACYMKAQRAGTFRAQKSPIYIPETETSLAYMAGLLDSDGYITINHTKPTGKTRQKSICHFSKIGVTNTNVILLQWCSNEFGGWYGLVGGRNVAEKKLVDGHKPEYEWQTTGSDAERVLSAVFPYLVVKKRQAELVFELEQLKVDKAFRRGSVVPGWVIEKRQALQDEMRILNKRGLK